LEHARKRLPLDEMNVSLDREWLTAVSVRQKIVGEAKIRPPCRRPCWVKSGCDSLIFSPIIRSQLL